MSQHLALKLYKGVCRFGQDWCSYVAFSMCSLEQWFLTWGSAHKKKQLGKQTQDYLAIHVFTRKMCKGLHTLQVQKYLGL